MTWVAGELVWFEDKRGRDAMVFEFGSFMLCASFETVFERAVKVLGVQVR